jgi:NAD-dependent deacetylase
MEKKKIIVLTGAGVSAESGLKTFRDADGLWEGYDVMEVASPDGWKRNKELVLHFYNERRKQLQNAKPNDAHYLIAKLEEKYNAVVITQNVDDLHERAGSSNVIHLHGELNKARSSVDPALIYDWAGRDICIGDKCERGSQLRPNVVWFGEMVPKMDDAIRETTDAEILIVVGTSLVVYPAASLVNFVPSFCAKYIIDPVKPEVYNDFGNIIFIQEKATVGMRKVAQELMGKL